MSDASLLGGWVRRFLLEHILGERNLARNTQRSYRDTFTLLIPFVAGKLHTTVDRLTVIALSADLLRLFLMHLEESRQSQSQPVISDWLRSTRSPALWASTVQNT